jgi:phosphoglycerate dehydrogenase-like enzyme
MALTLLVLADPRDRTLAALGSVEGLEVVVGHRAEDFGDATRRAEVFLVWSSDRVTVERVFAASARLRWVHSWAAGVDWLLFPSLREREVVVTNTRGVYSDSLAEFAVGAMLYFAKDLARMKASQRARRWEPFDVQMLRGSTLGIAGYGDIGRKVGALGASLGMKLLALRRRPERSSGDPLAPETITSCRELCERADYLVVAAPLTPETRHLIGAEEIAAMRPSAILVNVGRGAVVDQPALVDALQRGTLRGAALDVFETEPLPANDPLWGLDNVLVSPHTADHTATWREEAMRCFLENLRRYRTGEPLLHVVDKASGY